MKRGLSPKGASFNIPSNRFLWKKLGEYDAIVEYQEVANRLMLQDFEKSELPFRDYLTRVSKKVKINLDDITLKHYKSAIIQGYLVFPNASFDVFLDGYIYDVRQLLDDHFNTSNKKGCDFDKVVSALKDISVFLNIDPTKIKLYHYYRLLRNDLAHRLDKDYNDEYNDIDKEILKIIYPKLEAPNKKSSLSFDDFILCTANIKDLACQMTESLLPHIKWAQRTIEKKDIWIPRYKKYLDPNSRKRLENYINSTIFTNYGIKLEKNDLDSIIDPLE
jgi:hypothetical protein